MQLKPKVELASLQDRDVLEEELAHTGCKERNIPTGGADPIQDFPTNLSIQVF